MERGKDEWRWRQNDVLEGDMDTRRRKWGTGRRTDGWTEGQTDRVGVGRGDGTKKLMGDVEAAEHCEFGEYHVKGNR